MREKIKRVTWIFGWIFASLLILDLQVHAKEMNIYRLEENSEVKEDRSSSSATVVSLDEGTPVLILEQDQDWMKVQYQEYTGYLQTKVLSEESVRADADEEFAEVEETFQGIYQQTEDVRRKHMQGMIWGITVLVLAVVGIVFAVICKVKKNDREEKQED